ncbi:hypothetical protein KKF38_03490 [Patescibacteria group bacterium]|nr:hypothetical protein [Patescibacteria group bacterium]
MKNFGFSAIVFFLLVGMVALYSYSKDRSVISQSENISEISNTVQLGNVENTFIILSETFARQLSAFGFEFGDFSTAPDFFDFTNTEFAGDTAKTEILKNGIPFFTVFELQLSSGISFSDLQKSVADVLEDSELLPAAFGSDSFYFLSENLATNIIRFGGSALAFQFAPQNFEEIRGFISALLILN